MERILEIITKYKKLMHLALLLAMSIVFSLSFYYAGPFLESPTYLSLVKLLNESPLANNLIDITEMIMDAIIRSTYPIFILWAGIFYVYPFYKKEAEKLNNYIKILSLFISGPSLIFFVLGTITLGIGTYAYSSGSNNAGIYIIILSLIMFIIPGWYFQKCKTLLVSDENKLMEKYSKIGFRASGLLAFLGYTYSITIEPIRTIMAIYNVLPIS